MVKHILKGLYLLVAMAVIVSTAQGAVYKCRDTAGRLTIQDQPCGPGLVPLSIQGRQVATASHGHFLMWKASGPHGTAYLVGSLHFGTPDMYPLPAEMTRAYQASQALVVETDLTAINPTQMAQVVAAKAMYRNGSTLSKALSPEIWKELNRALAEFGMSAQLVEGQKPWFVSMTLTSLALRKFGFNEDLGIDNHFMKLAKGNKPILQMETLQQQLDFLDGFSAADQEEMLKETFQDLDKGREFLTDTLNAWKAGDGRKIDKLMNEELRTSAAGQRMYEVLVSKRNTAMSVKLDQLLRRGGAYFVVLGSAHFVGKEGIVAQLRDKGYTVKQY